MDKKSGGSRQQAPSPDASSATRSRLNPPPRRRPSPAAAAPAATVPAEGEVGEPVEQAREDRPPAPPRKQRSKREKHKPTGDYTVGYARPPVEHQFKGKAGPGRPRGSFSQDTILRRNLAQSRKVKIDGKVRTMPMREYLVMTQIKLAAEGKLAALKGLLAESARLYPEPADAQSEAVKAYPLGDGKSDGHILRELVGMLSIGEPNPESSDPWSDMAVVGSADEDSDTAPAGAWAEGDWDAEAPDQFEAEEDPDGQQ